MLKELKELGFKDVTYIMNSGIYVLLHKEIVMYVGQTTHLPRRLADHSRAITFDKILFVKCNRSELDRLEALMILKLKPVHGKAFSFNNNVGRQHHEPVYQESDVTHNMMIAGVELSLVSKGTTRLFNRRI